MKLEFCFLGERKGDICLKNSVFGFCVKVQEKLYSQRVHLCTDFSGSNILLSWKAFQIIKAFFLLLLYTEIEWECDFIFGLECCQCP